MGVGSKGLHHSWPTARKARVAHHVSDRQVLLVHMSRVLALAGSSHRQFVLIPLRLSQASLLRVVNVPCEINIDHTVNSRCCKNTIKQNFAGHTQS
jgi:hypothetical protein